MLFEQTRKNIKRIREVLAVLIKHGFAELVIHTPLASFLTRRKRLAVKGQPKQLPTQTIWERIRLVIETLGPTFIKGAQVMSNRPDLLPQKLIHELQKLQSEVPPFPFSQAKVILEEELGCPLEEVFEWVDEIPVGSASIGQVHKARLIGGEEVVVKVQRPGVAELVDTDLAILKEIAHRAENYLKRQGVLNPIEIVESFDRVMHRELRYSYEARNIDQFRNFYAEHTNFYIPKVYRELSTDRILVMEKIVGCKITDVHQIRAWGHDPEKVAETGMDIYLMQIFKYGYFHADPHPGNVWVQPNGIICLLDFGMVGSLMQEDKYAIAGIFVGIAQNDPKQVARSLRKLAIGDHVDEMQALEYDLSEFIQDFVNLEVQEVSIAEVGSRLQQIIYRYRMHLPGRVFLILRALAILEGIGRVIHPTFNTFDFVKPYGARLTREQFSPQNVATNIVSRLSELDAFFAHAPREARDLLRRINQGRLKVEVEDKGFHYLGHSMDTGSRRLAMSLIIAALLLTGGLILAASIIANPNATQEVSMPFPSVITFLAAGLLGLWWLVDLWRKV